MGLQLIKIVVGIFILIIFNSCSQKHELSGDWGAIDSYGSYSELYFSDSTIEIYDELAGTLASQTYSIKDDSLVTNILSYRIDWINPDSLLLLSDSFSLNLKRIKTGFKLSDYRNEKQEDSYIKSFYKRLNTDKRNGVNQVEGTNANQKIEEEVIEIRKKK